MVDNESLLKPINEIDISDELKELQHLMPIDPADRERLKKDIERTREIRVPIVCYQDEEGYYKILAGLNRWQIAQELNIDLIPVQTFTGTLKERKDFVINDNLSRRQMTEEDKIALVGYLTKHGATVAELQESLKKSERQIQNLRALYKEAERESSERGEAEPTRSDIIKIRDRKNQERKRKETKRVQRLHPQETRPEIPNVKNNPLQTASGARREIDNKKIVDNISLHEKFFNRLLVVVEKHIRDNPNGKGIKNLKTDVEVIKKAMGRDKS